MNYYERYILFFVIYYNKKSSIMLQSLIIFENVSEKYSILATIRLCSFILPVYKTLRQNLSFISIIKLNFLI